MRAGNKYPKQQKKPPLFARRKKWKNCAKKRIALNDPKHLRDAIIENRKDTKIENWERMDKRLNMRLKPK